MSTVNTAKIIIDVTEEVGNLGDLFGIFFEDLNHAADGGLYAQMIRNGSFEFSPIDNSSYHAMTGWEIIKGRTSRINHSVQCSHPLNFKNPHYLVVDVFEVGEEVGIKNEGYNSGISYEAGETYLFSCYGMTTKGAALEIEVGLEDQKGKMICKENFKIKESDWKKYSVILKPDVTEDSGRLTIRVKSTGRLYLDHISLFPKHTFLERKNGLRRDLAEFIKEMKPKFMRFPGGCLVHDGSLNADDRDSLYRWKNTIGKVEERPSKRNNWGYNQSLGLGYYEYFQFCEDIGAKPIPILPAAYDPHHQRMVPFSELEEWIQDALDLIEFANGDIESKWGKVRAELGHSMPFGLEYLGIGNEEVGEGFFDRYPYFHRAIKEKYPDIKLINSSGPFAAGSEYEKGWDSAKKYHSDLVDEHYYQAPEWFLANHHRYDDFKEEEPHVFLGEYASWGNTWYNALVEASFMIGLERNAPAVGLACYAPMLCNVDYVNWKPDMILFNNHEVYGTPNYYVQKLFMNYQGDTKLKFTLCDMPEILVQEDSLWGDIVLVPVHDTESKYYDIQIKNEDTGEEIHLEETYQLSQRDEMKVIHHIDANNYTISYKVMKVKGSRGFNLSFGKQDEQNKLNWELGGWQNMDSIIGEDHQGRNSCLTQSLFKVEIDREYTLRLEVREGRIRTYIDNVLINEATKRPLTIEPLYCSVSRRDDIKDIIVKIINVKDGALNTIISLEGIKEELYYQEVKVKAYIMEGYALEASNSFEQPSLVVPYEREFIVKEGCLEYEVKPQSVNILVFSLDEFN